MIDPRPVVAAIRQVAGEGMLPLHAPAMTEADVAAVSDCIRLDPVGYSFVDRIERMLESICRVRHCIATVNGTSALHLALMAVGVKPGDEVIAPSLSFVATANAIAYCGAVARFADASVLHAGIAPHKMQTLLMRCYRRQGGQLVSIASGRRLAAITMVHVLGRPAEGARMRAIADLFEVPLVEDAAQALGSLEYGRPCGSFGQAAILSFNANKIITTGGGGALLTNDDAIAAHVRHLATTAKRPHAWNYYHDAVGWNYRMPNINAALGVSQLSRLSATILAKRRLGTAYDQALAPVPGFELLGFAHGTIWNAWLNAILLAPEHRGEVDTVLGALHAAGISARACFTPMHRLPMYSHLDHDDLTVTDDISARMICLPSGLAIAEKAP